MSENSDSDGAELDNFLEPPTLVKNKEVHIYIDERGEVHRFEVGQPSKETKRRYQNVISALDSGEFRSLLDEATSLSEQDEEPDIDDGHAALLSDVAKGIHGDGRGIAGVCCAQLFTKSIEPGLTVRLHKGGKSTEDFSWREGWSLRQVDNRADVGTGVELNRRGILYSNTDGGAVMTRTLAESEPFTNVYEPAVAGPRQAWLEVVDSIEREELDPERGIIYLLKRLVDEKRLTEEFTEQILELVAQFATTEPSMGEVRDLISAHVRQADRGAPLLEIAVHSFLQVIEDAGSLTGELVQLQTLTSPDRRGGESTREVRDLGDVQLTTDGSVRVAWDAKLDITITHEELASLEEKLGSGMMPNRVGYTTLDEPELGSEVDDQPEDLEVDGLNLELYSLEGFIKEYTKATDSRSQTVEPADWLVSYVETLARQRPDRAVVRESPLSWLEGLQELLGDRYDLHVDEAKKEVDLESGTESDSTEDRYTSTAQQSGLDDFSGS
ncbi:hypothetical protein ACOJIV_07685 [Haloarcula sp. AONF1]